MRWRPVADTPNDPQAVADARLAEALESTGARDPREYYREQLRELKELDAGRYQSAVGWYREELIPSIATGGADPLQAWTEYGLTLAKLRAEGRTVQIDPTGRSTAYVGEAGAEDLILHLPDEKRQKAILVALPTELSKAQKASYHWLVAGKLKLPD